MRRGTILMIIGIAMQIISWIFSAISPHLSGVGSDSLHGVKVTLGYVSIGGWIVFIAGFILLQLDKRKLLRDSNKKDQA
jgi:Kef-type K+ transport system membrane component KefB